MVRRLCAAWQTKGIQTLNIHQKKYIYIAWISMNNIKMIFWHPQLSKRDLFLLLNRKQSQAIYMANNRRQASPSYIRFITQSHNHSSTGIQAFQIENMTRICPLSKGCIKFYEISALKMSIQARIEISSSSSFSHKHFFFLSILTWFSWDIANVVFTLFTFFMSFITIFKTNSRFDKRAHGRVALSHTTNHTEKKFMEICSEWWRLFSI